MVASFNYIFEILNCLLESFMEGSVDYLYSSRRETLIYFTSVQELELEDVDPVELLAPQVRFDVNLGSFLVPSEGSRSYGALHGLQPAVKVVAQV
jgi:hypothetical protein